MKKNKYYYVIKDIRGLSFAVNKYDIFEELPLDSNDILINPENMKKPNCAWSSWKRLKRISDLKTFYFSEKALKTRFFTTKSLKTAKILYSKG